MNHSVAQPIGVPTVLAIHDLQIRRHGGTGGVRSMACLEGCVASGDVAWGHTPFCDCGRGLRGSAVTVPWLCAEAAAGLLRQNVEGQRRWREYPDPSSGCVLLRQRF